jgi:hypothetical protein
MECTFFAAIGCISDARRGDLLARKGGQVLLHVFGAEGEVQAAQLAWEHRLVAETSLDVRVIVHDAALSGRVALREMVESKRRQHSRDGSESSFGSLSSGSSENVGRVRGHRRGGSHGSGKGYDFNVVSGQDVRSVGEVFQSAVGCMLAVLAALMVYMSAIIMAGTDRVASTVRRASSTGSKEKVRASRQSLDDEELIVPGCKRCYIYPDAGRMAIFEESNDGEKSSAEEKRQQKRDSRQEYEEDMRRGAPEVSRECKEREIRFSRVGDEGFWEGIRGMWY